MNCMAIKTVAVRAKTYRACSWKVLQVTMYRQTYFRSRNSSFIHIHYTHDDCKYLQQTEHQAHSYLSNEEQFHMHTYVPVVIYAVMGYVVFHGYEHEATFAVQSVTHALHLWVCVLRPISLRKWTFACIYVS